ncbi:hypothetical protein K1719_031641 [Acacia pycnantha]|nr:hypothetical protein K1719_031640 [Acacia pycnantha]KAI9086557.1 hypothetical protein K1719_031641 [Acacia pycnantha]
MSKPSLLSFCIVLLLALVFLFRVEAEDGKIGIYELRRGQFQIKLTNYGATIMSLMVPDRHGKLADVVLGFHSVDSYKV